MWGIYFLSIQTIGTMGTDWVNDVLFGSWVPDILQQLMNQWQVAQWLQELIQDGIVAGVGAVLGFVPQIFVLFLFGFLLEDCGYMARIAFVMDRLFRKFGLSGKSFIPMLIATGCGVPGVMASRTIENEKDRRLTVMVTTFMPCSAKLPIIALISGAFFPESSWVAPSAYFIGMGAIVLSGIALKKTALFAGDPAPFIMELPAYHLPQLGTVLKSAIDRAVAFIKKPERSSSLHVSLSGLLLATTLPLIEWGRRKHLSLFRPFVSTDFCATRLGHLARCRGDHYRIGGKRKCHRDFWDFVRPKWGF